MRIFLISFLILFWTDFLLGQVFKDSVQTKIWSRNAKREIVFSDWVNMPVRKISHLEGFSILDTIKVNKYGSRTDLSGNKTGFFYKKKIGNRWTLFDPLGEIYYEVGVTSVRTGKSPLNKSALTTHFGTESQWFSSTASLLLDNGFHSVGSWSDVLAAREYNKSAVDPIVYSTQLSVLNAFNAFIRKEFPERKISNIISLALDPTFPAFCEKHLVEQAKFKDDPHLFGHFSDNELPFLISSWESIISADSTDFSFLSAMHFLDSLKINKMDITKAQKEVFIASIAETYFKVVSSALKRVDPNHLYLGCRIHSSAKENIALLQVASKYVDIMSINYYGYWDLTEKLATLWSKYLHIPFFITEFYTKGDDVGMGNISGAGWIVRSQKDRAAHYENFVLKLLSNNQCVGWHWFRYQDNDPADLSADPSNNDANKGIVNTSYAPYLVLLGKMKEIHDLKFHLIDYFDKKL
jgi:hypothetical protein